MKGGSCYKLSSRLSFTLIALISLTLLVWIWEKTPLLTAVVPPSGQFEMSSNVHSSVISVRSAKADVAYPQQKPSTDEVQSDPVIKKVPPDPAIKEPPPDPAIKEVPSDGSADGASDLATHEVPSQRAKHDNFSTTTKSGAAHNILPVEHKKKSSSAVTNDGNSSEMVASNKKGCNYAKGKWVADSRRPLYSGFGCKQWVSEMWTCRANKRMDSAYESYRWQPKDCEMPEFEGSKFLARMQHKTIAFVGDSLGRQQFQSMMCMITGGRQYPDVEDIGYQYGLIIPPGALRPEGWAYRFPKTNTTILYYWSATLCELEPLNKTDRATSFAMHLDRPATFMQQYLHRFDVLVLNTGHHWNRGKFTGNRWVMYVNGKPNTDKKIAMIGNAKNLTVHSISKWVDSQLSQHPRLKAFFRTMAPRHFMNGDWNTGGSCDNTMPLAGGSEVTKDGSDDPVVEEGVKGTRVKLLDITALSKLRDDGHVSKYGFHAKPGMYDCLHWCLPGIPDTWNELLAAQV